MAELRLHINGPAADEVARALEDFFVSEFGVTPSRRSGTASEDSAERTDPVAVAALVLAVPSSLLAAMDLAERMRLKDKVERLITLVRKKTEPAHQVLLEAPDGQTLPLASAAASQVLDTAQTGPSEDAP